MPAQSIHMSGPNCRLTSGMARWVETSDSADVGGDQSVAGGVWVFGGVGAGRGATGAGTVTRGAGAVVIARLDAVVVARAGAAPIRGARAALEPLPGVTGASARLRPQWVHLITESRISPEQCGQVFME